MNLAMRLVRRVDRAQQGFGPAAFAFGVVKKFGDDRAGSLAALVAFYGFLSLFPLLLLLVTVLGIVAGGDRGLRNRIEGSALSQFPVIGDKLHASIGALHDNSGIGLAIGMVGLLWGSQRAVNAAQYAMAQVWNVPAVSRPSYWARMARTYLMIGALGVFLLLGTVAAGFAGFAGHRPLVARMAGLAVSLVLNVLLYVVAFRVLTPPSVDTRSLAPGAALGGIAWTALQYGGSLLVDHTLRHASQVYGFFAIVLGLIAWIYLGAQVTMYTAEMNVVTTRRLWPRSMVQSTLTDADRRVLTAISQQHVHRPGQRVVVEFDDVPPGPVDEGEDASFDT
jgi:YihY family inner membrane protein